MRCATARGWLSELRDGELRTDRRAAVESHLRDCAPCRAEADLLRRTDLAARTCLPAEEPMGPAFVGDLERRIAREGTRSAPEPAGAVRALVPMAAALLLGASLTFVGMHAAGPRAPAPAGPAVPSEYAGFEASRDRFAAASEMVLTDLDDLSLADPAQELTLVRQEVAAAGVEPAMDAVRRQLPAAETRDPRVAGRLGHAGGGMEAGVASLQRPGPPEDTLLHARREVLDRRLVASVRGLSPEGLPRPASAGRPASEPPNPGLAGDTAIYLTGVRAYAVGQLAEARQAFERAHAIAPRPDRRARAAYWASRCYTLENRPAKAAELLGDVQSWSPDAARRMYGFILRQPGRDVSLLFSGDRDGGSMTLEIQTATKAAGAAGAAPADGAQGEWHLALRLLESHGISLERELTRAMRQRSEVELVIAPWLDHLTDVVGVRADGAAAVPADAVRLRRVWPVMLAKMADRGLVEVVPAGEDRVTVRLSTAGIRFGSWEARRFVDSLGGDLAARLRGPATGDESTTHRSTLATLELDVRVPEARGAAAALRVLRPVPAPPAPPAPPRVK